MCKDYNMSFIVFSHPARRKHDSFILNAIDVVPSSTFIHGCHDILQKHTAGDNYISHQIPLHILFVMLSMHRRVVRWVDLSSQPFQTLAKSN